MIQKAIQYPALIKYLKGFSNYSWLHYCDGRKLLVAKSLCYFEKKLPDFFRVHKTALVNPHYIQDFQAPPGHKMSGSIRLKDGEVLPVSRRRWNQIVDPLTMLLLAPSAGYQSDRLSETVGSLEILTAKEALKTAKHQPARQIWVAMADEIKVTLLRQLMRERWPNWHLQLFDTGSGIQKALPDVDDTEMPAMIILDGSQANGLVTLRSVKRSSRFRLIPTVLLSSAGNHDLAELGYESGANSVIVQPTEPSRFIQVLEKTFRYWLTMASAPYAQARIRPTFS
ncbi:response regulator transcription factor [Larkinella sp. VNQ87]|uniref:response regulator transcription factor n=1 Tax=Larkinella sp. VNQ87 TaxID=3400921 RepID=UPI003C04C801